LDEELRAYQEMAAEEKMKAGLSRKEALRAVRLERGSLEVSKEIVRSGGWESFVETCWQDLRFGLRTLRKSPGFTLLAALCLALGTGVNTSVFALLDFTMLRPLPVPKPNRTTLLTRAGNDRFSYPDYLAYRDRGQTFAALAASFPTESSLDDNEQSHLISAEAVSANYFKTMGIAPFIGRWFTDESEPVAVLSYPAWRNFFNGDPNILGKSVRSETQWYTVIGVASPAFTGINAPIQTAIWVPLHMWAEQYPERAEHLFDRANPSLRVMVLGRLEQHVTLPEAAANLNAVDAELRRETPAISEAAVAPLAVEIIHGAPSPFSRSSAAPLDILFVVVGSIVLLIACVNVGNLLLARGTARQQELSVRAALGAGQGRLLRQLLVETFLLSLLGVAGGLVLNQWSNHILNAAVGALPVEARVAIHPDLSLNSRVFLFALGLCFLCTLLCGVLPARRAVRRDVYPILKGGGTPGDRVRLRQVSLVGQVGLSLILLLCAGLFLRSIYRMRAAEPGFAVQHRLYALTYISAPEFTQASGLQFYEQTVERLRALPGIRNAAVTRFLPLMITGAEKDCISTGATSPLNATFGVISPSFLRTMKIPLLEGRDFTADDGTSSAPVVLVSQALARHLWGKADAVGQHVLFGCGDSTTAEVVGVVRDTKVDSLGEPPQAHFYRPFTQRYTGLATVVVETSADPASVARTVSSLIRSESSGARIYDLQPIATQIERSYWIIRLETTVLLILGLLALVLAAVGLYGVVAFHAAQRTQEIGLRMALGATPGEIHRLILFRGIKITLAGVLIGIAVSAGLARLLARFLSGLSPVDPLTFAVSAGLWIGVALLACYLPARRAMRVDPMVALRYE
jgi:putative ABC transport system permease protein